MQHPMVRTFITVALTLITIRSSFTAQHAHHATSGMKDALLTVLRSRDTQHDDFRIVADKLAYLLAAEVAQKLDTISVAIETPLMRTYGTLLAHDIVLVPIVRSGLALLHSFTQIFEGSRVGFVVVQRDEKTALPQLFYSKMPPLHAETRVVILEPMIATGGSVCSALHILRDMGVEMHRVIVASVICASEGLQAVRSQFPEVTLVYAAEDPELNDKKFIVPGLGDFGDRYFGTE